MNHKKSLNFVLNDMDIIPYILTHTYQKKKNARTVNAKFHSHYQTFNIQ